MRNRPETSEYDPFFSTYIDQVPDGDILSILAESLEKTMTLLATCPEDQERYRYDPGKWSIREVVGHISDAERLYAYRTLHLARADPSPLPGMNPLVWAGSSNASDRPLSHLVEELAAVRAATVRLMSSFDEATWRATGVAGGRPFTVRSLAYVIAGHEIHHRSVLEERYLDGI
ncbi:MAG: DinB family protein [bacterium]|nr:DinB family protein [bacterium]